MSMREVVLLVRHNGEPESDLSAKHPSVTLRSRSSLTGRSSDRRRIIEVDGPADEVAAFVEEFGAADSIVELEALTPLGRDRVFIAVTIDASRWDSIAERLSDIGVHHRSGTVIQAGWERWTLYLDSDESLSAIVESLEEAGNETQLRRDVELRHLEANDQLDLTRLAHELTARQTEVLTTAIEMDYYEPSRGASIEEVGEALGISRSTAWEHLNRAERKVMREIHSFLRTRS